MSLSFSKIVEILICTVVYLMKITLNIMSLNRTKNFHKKYKYITLQKVYNKIKYLIYKSTIRVEIVQVK